MSKNEIKSVSVCDILGDNFVGDYDEECRIVKEYVKEHDAHYYGKPREDFFMFEAFEEAEAKGKSIVVVEDLS